MATYSIRFYKNVPFNADNVMDFTYDNLRTTFLDNYLVQIGGADYVDDCRLIVRSTAATSDFLLNADIDDIKFCNYCRIYNNTTAEKTFCFIRDIVATKEGQSQITVEIDAFQTYLGVSSSDIDIGAQFIEREHQDRFNTSSKPIYNTRADLDLTGNVRSYMTRFYCSTSNDNTYLSWFLIVWSDTSTGYNNGMCMPQDVSTYILIPYIFGASSSAEIADSSGTKKSLSEISGMIGRFTGDSRVKAMYLIPKANCPVSVSVANNVYTMSYDDSKLIGWVTFSDLFSTGSSGFGFACNMKDKDRVDFNGSAAQTFTVSSGYMPSAPTSENNSVSWTHEPKLYTYPYSYIDIAGTESSMVLRFEDLTLRGTFDYRCYVRFTPSGATYKIIPSGYTGDSSRTPKIIASSTYGKLLALRTEAWKEYLISQKAAADQTRNLSLLIGGLQIAGGVAGTVASGGSMAAFGLSTAVSGVGAVASTLGKQAIDENEIKNRLPGYSPSSTQPDADAIAEGYAPFSSALVSLRADDRNAAFAYWYKYGYPCGIVKTPSLRSRYWFNYIKTVGCNLLSGAAGKTRNIPDAQRRKLESQFDAGLTIWHYRSSANAVMTYGYENLEMSLRG